MPIEKPDSSPGAPETQPQATRETGTATLPGTAVSAGAWAQFQRRMELRRETTLLGTLRRAMEAGDYRTALERANDLVAIDPSWNEIKLFLEDLVAGRVAGAEQPDETAGASLRVPQSGPGPDGAARQNAAKPAAAGAAARRAATPSAPSMAVAQPAISGALPSPAGAAGSAPSPAATTAATAVRMPAESRPVATPHRSRRLAAASLVVFLLLFAVAVWWTLAPPDSAETVGRWIASFGSEIGNEVVPSPVPVRASRKPDLPEPVPELPPAADVPPAPPLPEPPADENDLSQNRNSASPGIPNPPSAAGSRDTTGSHVPAPPARAYEQDAGNQTKTDRQTTTDAQPQTKEAQAAPPVARQPATAPSLPASPPRDMSSASSAGPPPAPASTPPVTPPAAAVAPPVTALPPSPSIAPFPPSGGERLRPEGGGGETRPETGMGSGTPPDARPTTGLLDRAADERSIDATLDAYAGGYTALDAAAVKRVWPTVNVYALKSAFEQLESQRVALAGCSVDVRGLHASATCRGTARYVPKVGSGDPVSMARVWQFSLRKVVDAWVIESVR